MNNFPPYDNWLTAFNPNFPTTFTDAASYLEQLERCYRKMHETLSYVHSLKQELAALAEEAARLEFAKVKDGIDEDIQELELKIRVSEEKLLKMLQDNSTEMLSLIHETNDITVDLINSVTDLMDTKLLNLSVSTKTDIEELKGKLLSLNKLVDANQAHVAEELNYLMDDTTDMWKEIVSLYSEFNLFKQHVNNQFDSLCESLMRKLDEQIARIQGDLILVTNPLTGQPDQLRDVLSSIAQWKTPLPIKFKTFNSLKVGFTDFNAMHIPFLDFNNFAGLIFWKDVNYPPFIKEINSINEEIDALKKTLWWDFLTGNHISPYEAFRNLASYVIDMTGTPIAFENFNRWEYTFEQFNGWEMPIQVFNVYFRAWVLNHEG